MLHTETEVRRLYLLEGESGNHNVIESYLLDI